MQPPHRRRRDRKRTFRVLRRIAFVILLLLVLLPPLPWLAVVLFVDVNSVRSGIETAVLHATGRTLSLGKVTMLRSLPPTLAAESVTFANAPGGSRPDMLRVPYAEATFGIVPLLFGQLEVRTLVLSRPDLVLECDPAGSGNWQFSPAMGEPGAARPHLSRRPRWARRHLAQARVAFTLEMVRIREGQIAWRNESGAWTTLDLRRLDAMAPAMDARTTLTAQIAAAERMLNIGLSTGPLARLRESGSAAPWPVRLELDTPGAHASVAGTLSRPGELGGYRLAIEGTAENLGDLQGLLHARLPPLRKLAFAARLSDSGGPIPNVSGITVRARASDLGAWVPGLSLDAVELAAEDIDKPVHGAIDGDFDGHPLHLAASLGPPAALFSSRLPGPLPIQVSLEAAGGWLTVKGAVAAPERGQGLDLEVAGSLPDLQALSPLFGHRLPAFRNVTLGLHAGDGVGGFRQAVALRNLALRSSEADLSGEMDLAFAPRTAIRAVLRGSNLDLDALHAALAGTGFGLPAAPAAATAPWLIPSDRLPLDGIGRADLDLRADVSELQLGGERLNDVSLALHQQSGELSLDRLRATLPGGGIEAKGTVDVRGRFPLVSVSVQAAGVPAQPALAAIGLPDAAYGTLNLTAGLNSTGASWRELAAGLNGQASLALVDGELGNRLLDDLLGPPLRAIGISLATGGGPAGRTPARCLAVRADAVDGLAALHDFVLDTPGLLLQGDGALLLRDERLALRLMPAAPAGGRPAPIVRIGGVFSRTTVFPEQRAPTASYPMPALPPQPCADARAIAKAALPR